MNGCVVRERMLSGRFNGESSQSLFKEMGKENGYLREMNAQKGHGSKGLAESARVCKNQRMDATRDEKASQKWYGSLNEHTAPKREKTSSCVVTVTKQSRVAATASILLWDALTLYAYAYTTVLSSNSDNHVAFAFDTTSRS